MDSQFSWQIVEGFRVRDSTASQSVTRRKHRGISWPFQTTSFLEMTSELVDMTMVCNPEDLKLLTELPGCNTSHANSMYLQSS